jgi:hypothetical protein
MNDLKKKLILIELNEINFDIAKKYLKDFELKNINLICNDLSTSCSESEYSKLEPWIQWVSVHTGLSADDHKVFRLGESKSLQYEQIFEKIEKKGFDVGVLFSMNAVNKTIKPKYFVPDPWTETDASNSFWCKNLHKSIRQVVNDNSEGKIKFKSYLIILLACIKFVRITKYYFFLKLLINSFRKSWYKALFLDFLISEIHVDFLKNKKTNFSTVFYNGGAHIQHHYFFNSKKIVSKFKNPTWYVNNKEDPFKDMLFFYNKILENYFDLKNEYNLIIATGLSQEPYNKIKFYYRLKNHNYFLNKLNIKYTHVQKLMTRDFFIFFSNNEDRDFAKKILFNITSEKKEKIFNEIESKEKCLFVTLTYPNQISKNFKIITDEQIIDFYNEVNFVAIKNGMHSSKGYFFFSGDISKFKPENNSHIKSIYNSINVFFSQKS